MEITTAKRLREFAEKNIEMELQELIKKTWPSSASVDITIETINMRDVYTGETNPIKHNVSVKINLVV